MENTGFKYNWGKFYWDAWLNDINLQSCDLAAQGLWINLIAIMHKSDQIGYLVINGRPMTLFDIAKRVGVRKDRVERLLQKLIENDVCSVSEEGIVFCRRIVREEKRRLGSLKKKSDNQINDGEKLFDYRYKSQGEHDVISNISSYGYTKENRHTIDIAKYIGIKDDQYKSNGERKYEVMGTRLSKLWFPDHEAYEYACRLDLYPEEILEDFRDYWHAKVGREAIKMDWDATWRRWCRVASQRKQKRK